MRTGGGGNQGPWRRKTVGTLVAGFLLVYLIAVSPHLVQHLFEEDHDSPACPFLALSQHTPELQLDPLTLTHLVLTGIFEGEDHALSIPSPLIYGNHPRAPPRSRPST